MAEAAYLVTQYSTFSPGLQHKGYPRDRKGPRVWCASPSESWEGELTSGFVRFKPCHPPSEGEVLPHLRIGEWKPMASVGVAGVLTWALEQRLKAPGGQNWREPT